MCDLEARPTYIGITMVHKNMNSRPSVLQYFSLLPPASLSLLPPFNYRCGLTSRDNTVLDKKPVGQRGPSEARVKCQERITRIPGETPQYVSPPAKSLRMLYKCIIDDLIARVDIQHLNYSCTRRLGRRR